MQNSYMAKASTLRYRQCWERQPPARVVEEARRCDLQAFAFAGEAERARLEGRPELAAAFEQRAASARAEALRILGAAR